MIFWYLAILNIHTGSDQIPTSKSCINVICLSFDINISEDKQHFIFGYTAL